MLAALPSAVDCARRFVRHTLWRWRLHDLIDTTEAVAAELVSDAVARTGIAVKHPGYVDLYGKHLNLLVLCLRVIGDRVFVEVWDADSAPPWWPDEPPASGRERAPLGAGTAVSDVTPTGDTVTRADLCLPLPVPEDTAKPILPHRTVIPHPSPPQARPISAAGDPQLLRRVLDGLHRLPSDGPSKITSPTHPDFPKEDS